MLFIIEFRHCAREEWCHQHGVRALKDGCAVGSSGPVIASSSGEKSLAALQEIQPRWEDILLELKLKTAKEQLPGKRVSVRVLKGKWQGSYMAQALLGLTITGSRYQGPRICITPVLTWSTSQSMPTCLDCAYRCVATARYWKLLRQVFRFDIWRMTLKRHCHWMRSVGGSTCSNLWIPTTPAAQTTI